MADCKLIKECVFFNDKMSNMPSMAEMFKKKYCKKDYSECARYIVFQVLGRENIPPDLFPNMKDVAQKDISKDEKPVKLKEK